MPSINLLDKSYDLVVPASYAVRWEIAALANVSVIRARAAAIVATVPGAEKRFKVKPLVQHGFSVGSWAGDCFDALTRAGVKLESVMESGETAIDFLTEGLVTDADVDAAEGFSEAPGEQT